MTDLSELRRFIDQVEDSGALGALVSLDQLADAVRAATVSHVHQMRSEGWTWADVGAALDISRQAAQQRFAGRMPNDAEDLD